MKSHLTEFQEIMKKENLNQIVIDTFSNYYEKVLKGATGLLTKSEISTPSAENVRTYEALKNQDKELLDKLAIIKLNGGLGTSMGLKRAKSLLPVKNKMNFLDIIAKQVKSLHREAGKKVPILFMNSFNTQKDTLEFLKSYPSLKIDGLPLDFVQNKFPKVKKSNFAPLKNSNDNLNWNPPGHGDIYMALTISKVLDKLLDKGIEYIFVSNSDNLGAIVDYKILTYLHESESSFLMEVCNRTEMDKKGGHLAETKDGKLVLREIAQCPSSELKEFQNIEKYKYFNTNNLWINLKHLKTKMDENNNVLQLPLILNQKEVEGEKVYQIETAMGAAINVFENSKAIVVPRSRFSPVKKTNDLLAVWSDAYELTKDNRIILTAKQAPIVDLDSKYYKSIYKMKKRFLDVPSLKECKRLTVKGDVTFGKNLKFKGNIDLETTSQTKLQNLSITNN